MPIENDGREREQRIARVALVTALLLAAALQGTIAFRSLVIGKDGVLFINIAKTLQESPKAAIVGEDQHPGFPALVMAIHPMVSRIVVDPVFSWISSARIVGGVTGLLCLVLVWQISRRLLGGYAAAMAALIFAVHPLFRANSVDVMSDTPHLFFYLLGAWTACEGIMRREWRWFIATGASSALAYWIRPEGLALAFVTAGLLGLYAIVRRMQRAQNIAGAVSVILIAGLLITPYVLIKGELTGKKQLFPDIPESIKALDDDKASQLMSPATAGASMAWPGIRLIARRLMEGFRYILLLPLAVGLFASGRTAVSRDGARLVLALVMAHLMLLAALISIAGYLGERHTMPVVALSMPWVGWGTWRILTWLGAKISNREKLLEKFGHTRIAIAVGLLAVLPMTPRTVRPLHDSHRQFAEAGLALRRFAAPKDLVLSNLPYTAFYANLESNQSKGIHISEVFKHPSYARHFRFIVLDKSSKLIPKDWMNHLPKSHEHMDVTQFNQDWDDMIVLVRKAP